MTSYLLGIGVYVLLGVPLLWSLRPRYRGRHRVVSAGSGRMAD